jgi:hypothetical protein
VITVGKETPEEYRRRRALIDAGLRESPQDYWDRKERVRDNQKRREKEKKRRKREEEQKKQREREYRKAEEDLIRVKQGYKPGQGYVASDGRVYPYKETPEEYHARKMRGIKKEIERRTGEKYNIPGEGCFIATVVYGDINAPEVIILRKFRDEKLKRTQAGRFFIRTYYKFGPYAARFLSRHARIKRMMKKALNFVAKVIGLTQSHQTTL